MWTAEIQMKWSFDHRSYNRNLSNCKFKPEKNFWASTGFEPMASALALQCSTNWAPNIWVFIAQLVEHCSANAEAMGSNPVEAQKFFSSLNLQLLKLRL